MARLIIQFGRSRLILGLVVLMGFVFGYLTYSGADDPTSALLIKEPVTNDKDWNSFQTFKIDFEILDDERYKALQVYGENPVYPGIVGDRENPFLPLGR